MVAPLVGVLLGKTFDAVASYLDPTKKTEAQLALLKLQQDGLFKEIDTALAYAQQQNAINLEEAKSESLFKSGWRPAAGWVCVGSLGLIYIPKALVMAAIWTYQCVVVLQAWHGGPVPPLPAYPDLGLTDIMGLLGSLLGIGTMRTYEKVRQAA